MPPPLYMVNPIQNGGGHICPPTKYNAVYPICGKVIFMKLFTFPKYAFKAFRYIFQPPNTPSPQSIPPSCSSPHSFSMLSIYSNPFLSMFSDSLCKIATSLVSPLIPQHLTAGFSDTKVAVSRPRPGISNCQSHCRD